MLAVSPLIGHHTPTSAPAARVIALRARSRSWRVLCALVKAVAMALAILFGLASAFVMTMFGGGW